MQRESISEGGSRDVDVKVHEEAGTHRGAATNAKVRKK